MEVCCCWLGSGTLNANGLSESASPSMRGIGCRWTYCGGSWCRGMWGTKVLRGVRSSGDMCGASSKFQDALGVLLPTLQHILRLFLRSPIDPPMPLVLIRTVPSVHHTAERHENRARQEMFRSASKLSLCVGAVDRHVWHVVVLSTRRGLAVLPDGVFIPRRGAAVFCHGQRMEQTPHDGPTNRKF